MVSTDEEISQISAVARSQILCEGMYHMNEIAPLNSSQSWKKIDPANTLKACSHFQKGKSM